MKAAVIFVHGSYPKSQLGFYRRLCVGKYKIAVDGGYNFFRRAKIKPDIVIGDFDSLKKSSVKGIDILSFPRRKDATDTELAVSYCIDKRFRMIEIVMPAIGEPDHFLGILSLLSIPELSWMKESKVAARIVNHFCEIMLITNREITYTDCNNELLSVLPYEGPIRLTCKGMMYPAEELLIKPWQGRGMRNIFGTDSSTIKVKGTAILIHYWKKIS